MRGPLSRFAVVATIAVASIATVAAAPSCAHAETPVSKDTVGGEAWKNDWELANGFALDIDSEGYRFPTSIAFVPRPGSAPKDPLYFVTELRGAIKVVTNDRSVFTFADNFFRLELPEELPSMRAEIGLGAVSLDPVHGYVFASFGYQDDDGYLHNDIIRFETTPTTFATAPTASQRFTDVFIDFPSSRSHQIGHMAIIGETLYAAVGDALQSAAGRDVSSVLGKILRMTLDGKPLADNPFATGQVPPVSRDYVWAYGLRNPFGLLVAEGKLFAAENGPSVDRFVRIERGRSYGYDGTDWSMGTHALAVFAPSVGPAQAAWLPADDELFPSAFRSAFYLTFGGSLLTMPGPGPRGERSIVYMRYDQTGDVVLEPPQPLVRYRGDALQMPVGVAVGPDALYFVPLFPVRNETGAVLRVTHAPERGHSLRIDRDASPAQLLTTYGCHGCHASYEDRPSVGPPLDPPGLVARVHASVHSAAYRKQLEAVEALDQEPYVSFRDARHAVATANGKEKVKLWLTYRLLEPRFDSTDSLMPNQGLTRADADTLARYFVDSGWGKEDLVDADASWLERLRALVPVPRYRHFLIPLLVGVAIGFFLARRRWALARKE